MALFIMTGYVMPFIIFEISDISANEINEIKTTYNYLFRYKFRPGSDNPYLHVSQDSDEEEMDEV